MGACFQTFVARGHASALLQLTARCDSGSPRFSSVAEGKEGESARGKLKEEGNEADAPLFAHVVLKKTPPSPGPAQPSPLLVTALHLLCLVLSPSRRELSLLRVSGRRVIVETHGHKTLVLAMTSTYNLDFHPLAESRLMSSGDTM